jgi:hypothetical protein
VRFYPSKTELIDIRSMGPPFIRETLPRRSAANPNPQWPPKTDVAIQATREQDHLVERIRFSTSPPPVPVLGELQLLLETGRGSHYRVRNVGGYEYLFQETGAQGAVSTAFYPKQVALADWASVNAVQGPVNPTHYPNA